MLLTSINFDYERLQLIKSTSQYLKSYAMLVGFFFRSYRSGIASLKKSLMGFIYSLIQNIVVLFLFYVVIFCGSIYSMD